MPGETRYVPVSGEQGESFRNGLVCLLLVVGWLAAFRRFLFLAGQPTSVSQRFSQNEIHLTVRTAQIVLGPAP